MSSRERLVNVPQAGNAAGGVFVPGVGFSLPINSIVFVARHGMTNITKPTPFPTVQQLLDTVRPRLAKEVKASEKGRRGIRRGAGNLPGLLKQACERLDVELTAPADRLLGAAFDASLVRLAKDEALPPKKRNNLRWALSKWQEHLRLAFPGLIEGVAVAAPVKAPRLVKLADVLEAALRAKRLSVTQVAAKSGVDPATFTRWLKGRALPDARSSDMLPVVEQTLGLADGTLVPFLKEHRSRRPLADDRPESQWSLNGGSPIRSRAPRLFDSDIPTGLKSSWRQMVREHVARRGTGRGRKSAGWKLNAVKSRSKLVPWHSEVDDKHCPTAERHWNAVRGFLAFSRSQAFQDSFGTGEADLTLAWLAVPDAVCFYAESLIDARDEMVNGTVQGFAAVVSLLCRDGGWIRRNEAQLRHELPDAYMPADWDAGCEDAVEALQELLSDFDTAERDWDEFMRPYLEHQDPATPVLEAIAKLMREADALRPTSMDRARLLRDAAVLSFQLLIPLRTRTLAHIEIRPTAGHVRFADFKLYLNIPKRILKNGSVRGDLKTCLEGELVHVLKRYVDEARPVLCGGADVPWLFVSSRNPDDPWLGISVQIGAVTARMCGLGIPAHMFRHLVATRHLRHHPKDYVGVAALLHDSLVTVLKRYAPKDPTEAFSKNSVSLRLPR